MSAEILETTNQREVHDHAGPSSASPSPSAPEAGRSDATHAPDSADAKQPLEQVAQALSNYEASREFVQGALKALPGGTFLVKTLRGSLFVATNQQAVPISGVVEARDQFQQ